MLLNSLSSFYFLLKSLAMSDTSLRRTPLYDHHVRLGGKIVPFAGWEMPVQYSGVVAEHVAVRQQAGLFDVSHMGEIFVTGPEAEVALDNMTCNDVKPLADGKALYSAITTEKGGVVDDIIVYRYSRERYLLCVNASNAERDFAWFTKHNRWKATFENRSAEWGQVALQGPKAERILIELTRDESWKKLGYFFFRDATILGSKAIVARTGYTGEDGFEIFFPWAKTGDLWDGLLEAGRPHGLVPAGLGARDSLRLEACLPLHGHELAEDVSAIESGIGWAVKVDKGPFIGREVLAKQRRDGAPRALVGIFVDDAGIVRHQDVVKSEAGVVIGAVTSGTKTPTVNKALGLALVDAKFRDVGTKLIVEVRGRPLRAHVVARPFYKRPA